MLTYNIDSNANEIRMTSDKDLDSTISNLKSRLFDLEQQEKDHNALRQKLSQLKNQFQVLTTTKCRLEQELKQKDETYNQRINGLRNDNENLQLNYNEKLSLNKKLFTENDLLEKEILERENELNDLRNKLRDLNNQLGQSLSDKGDLENQVQKLKNIKAAQLNDINKLTKENKNLSQIINDQDNKLQKAQEDIALMESQSQENDIKIQNLNDKLRLLNDDITNTQNVLNKNNLDNRNLDDKLNELNTQCENIKCENADLNNNILKERALIADKQRQNDSLTAIINDHEIQINDLTDKYNTLNALYTQATNDNKNSQIENGKYKEHIMLLTKQNQKLMGELETIKDQDLRMKTLLSRKDQSSIVIRNVHDCIEQATICLGKIENDPINYRRNNNLMNSTSSNGKYRSISPTLRYNFISKNEK